MACGSLAAGQVSLSGTYSLQTQWCNSQCRFSAGTGGLRTVLSAQHVKCLQISLRHDTGTHAQLKLKWTNIRCVCCIPDHLETSEAWGKPHGVFYPLTFVTAPWAKCVLEMNGINLELHRLGWSSHGKLTSTVFSNLPANTLSVVKWNFFEVTNGWKGQPGMSEAGSWVLGCFWVSGINTQFSWRTKDFLFWLIAVWQWSQGWKWRFKMSYETIKVTSFDVKHSPQICRF